jgi:molybdenum cofactor synthesis domain-containing protein
LQEGIDVQVGILTISDRASAGEYEDRSGPALREIVEGELGWTVALAETVPDEQDDIERRLKSWSDEEKLDLVLTTGGTGFAPRDRTPEATRAVVERETPGLAEAMRAASLQVTPHAMLSRAVAGIRGRTLIVNLPGSPKAVRENLEVLLPVLPHALELLRESPDAEAGHQYDKRARPD